jgi:hypothetical protein
MSHGGEQGDEDRELRGLREITISKRKSSKGVDVIRDWGVFGVEYPIVLLDFSIDDNQNGLESSCFMAFLVTGYYILDTPVEIATYGLFRDGDQATGVVFSSHHIKIF